MQNLFDKRVELEPRHRFHSKHVKLSLWSPMTVWRAESSGFLPSRAGHSTVCSDATLLIEAFRARDPHEISSSRGGRSDLSRIWSRTLKCKCCAVANNVRLCQQQNHLKFCSDSEKCLVMVALVYIKTTGNVLTQRVIDKKHQ